MKSTKQFLSLLLLFGAVTSFASQQNPCSDGFCDKPSSGCKKKTTTDKLFVKDCAKICGDLTVRGEIHNLELQLLRDSGVPPTDEVYNQFFQYPFAQNILENIQDFSVPRNLVVPGTEINPDAPIYGYNAETQKLILGGGPELSYNPDFTEVNLRYHGQNPTQLPLATPENMQAWYEHTLSYYLQRGFEMPGIDVYPQYEGQFIFSNNLVGDNDFVSIKFYYEDGPIPVALDLVATAADSVVVLDLFEPNPDLRKNGFYYPMRIPITTDFAEFNHLFYKEPIAYYDNLHRRITIHVPECNNTPTELFEFVLSVTCCNCNLDANFKDSLVSFDGTFNLMRRNGENQLVSSGFNELEYLIQASSVVSVKSNFILFGEPFTATRDYNFSEPGGVFAGLAIPLMNGAGPQADIYAINNGVLNAFTFFSDPLIFPALEDGLNSFQAGDNPVTTLVENYGSPTYNGYFDSEVWNFVLPGLPLPVMEGKTTPEENPEIPFPEFFVTPSKIFNPIVAHEYLHNTQIMQGMIFYLPTEGQATALEQDPKLNSSVYSAFRGEDWGGQYMPRVTRGLWPLTLPEITSGNVYNLQTYGSSIFWRYLATQFDYNYQVVRRMGDIMSHETFGPLLEENGIPYQHAFVYGGEIGYNPAGSLLALAQALDELYEKDIQDVFSDYAVSLAMLRNNTSIPEQYRHEYPYWLASPTYPWYEFIALFEPGFATWWQDYQDNVRPSVPDTAIPFIPTAQLATSPALPGSPYPAAIAAYSPFIVEPVSGLGAIADDGIIPTDNACSTLTNDLTNKVGVCRRGVCAATIKTTNIENAGGIGTVIANNVPGNPIIFIGAPTGNGPTISISQEDGDTVMAALDANPNITLTVEQAPFIPVLDQDVLDAVTQDMTLLMFEVPQDVNTVTVDVAEGEWRLSVVQFTSDGTPVGQFIIDGPHANNGGQTVFDITQFPRDPESGSVRLVCANVTMPTYDGLNSWCGAEPIYTGRISIMRS